MILETPEGFVVARERDEATLGDARSVQLMRELVDSIVFLRDSI